MSLMGGRSTMNIDEADIKIGDSMSNIDAASNLGGKRNNSKRQKNTQLPSMPNKHDAASDVYDDTNAAISTELDVSLKNASASKLQKEIGDHKYSVDILSQSFLETQNDKSTDV